MRINASLSMIAGIGLGTIALVFVGARVLGSPEPSIEPTQIVNLPYDPIILEPGITPYAITPQATTEPSAPPMSVDEFEALTQQPENAERHLEYIAGEVVEENNLNTYSSEVSGVIFGELYIFLKDKNLGHLTMRDSGYMVSGERYAPDVAYLSYLRQSALALDGYNPMPPELAVEVDMLASEDADRLLRFKIANYLAAGTTVWVVLPDQKHVEVYMPGRPVQVLDKDKTLDGGTLLPGFSLPVKTIFKGQGH